MDYLKISKHYPEYERKIDIFKDKVNRVKKTNTEVFTDFLNPDEREILKHICKKEGLYFSFLGGIGDFERAICAISPYDDLKDFPIEVVRIAGNSKFEKLDHRDYLGAILSLGISRDKIGDINLFEETAEVWVCSTISSYILNNLNKIKHASVKVEIIKQCEAQIREQKFKDMLINVSSMRLDCIVSALIGISRNDAVSIIKKGNVKVDYVPIEETAKKVDEKNLISIKGFGRFIINNIISKTKSDRLKIYAKKFI